MSLWVPNGAGDFTWRKSNVDSTRPASGSFGTVITANTSTTNTKGNWTEILSASDMAFDGLGLYIAGVNVAQSGSAENTVLDIGVDPSGGSSYTVIIPDLVMADGGAHQIGGGINYYFPIWIRAGSSVAGRAQTSSGVSGHIVATTLRVVGQPRRPELVWCGTAVTAFGVDLATTKGVAVTSGTTNEGAYTAITTNISNDFGWWQLGFGADDASLTNGNIYTADLAYGDASNKHLIIQDQLYTVTTTGETLACAGKMAGCGRRVKAGNNLYGRLQCSGTSDSNTFLSAYGLR